MAFEGSEASTVSPTGQSQARDILEVIDQRTGAHHELPIRSGTVTSMDFRAVRTGPDDFGLMAYDPGLLNTAVCRSAITLVDGERGILEYRGYPIEGLSAHSSFLEVAYLLINGELPTAGQLREWEDFISRSYELPQGVVESVTALPRDTHPMSLLMGLVSIVGATDRRARVRTDATWLREVMCRLIAQIPVLSAIAWRHTRGKEFIPPDPGLGIAGNVLRMFFAEPGRTYSPDPVLERGLDVLFIMHADHEQNCSTNVLRNCFSADADPYSAVVGALAALSGPLHGAANEAVLNMLREIGSVENVPAFIDDVKAGRGKLMGFGHRVYKTYDPRAKLIKQTADSVFQVTGVNPRLEIALELEKLGLSDQYFTSRRLNPNVDFYSGLIYEALGLPSEMFPVMFAIARSAGWAAHVLEFHADPERKIVRPRQVYTGPQRREYPSRD